MGDARFDQFGLRYLRLTLEVEKHIPGLIDAYLGPDPLRLEVAATPPLAPTALLDEVATLQAAVPGDDPDRASYLQALLRSLETLLRQRDGETFTFLEETALLYDIRPELVQDAVFEAALRDLDTALPGNGNLAERMQSRRARFEIAGKTALPHLGEALRECRQRAQALYILPDGESVELALTSEKPWGAYNWYRGDYRSLVEFNTDLPVFLPGVLDTMAHEGYPGHHTEGVLKERDGVRAQRKAELASFLILSPMAVIAEGIATTARERIFPNDEDIAWTNERLLQPAGMAPEPIEQTMAIREASHRLRYLTGNAAIHLHANGWQAEAVLDYLETYGLLSRHRAEKRLASITHPLWRTYVFSYTSGYDLLNQAGNDDRNALFDRVLGQAVLPSTLAAQVDVA